MSLSNTPAPLGAAPTPEQIKTRMLYEHEEIVRRSNALSDALWAMLKENRRIENDKTYGDFLENKRMVGVLERDAKEKHDEAKKPYLVAGRAIDSWFKDNITAPLAEPGTKAQALINDYGARKAAAAREEAERKAREAEEAARKAAEEAAAAQAALFADDDEAAALANNASTALQVAEKARQEAAGKFTVKSRGVYGATGSVTTRWLPRLVDMKLVPPEYTTVDWDHVARKQHAAKKGPDGRPLLEIPGIEFVADTTVRVR